MVGFGLPRTGLGFCSFSVSSRTLELLEFSNLPPPPPPPQKKRKVSGGGGRKRDRKEKEYATRESARYLRTLHCTNYWI